MRDYMLRKAQAQIERSHAPCEKCGHPHREHREHGPSFVLTDAGIETVEHPEYLRDRLGDPT